MSPAKRPRLFAAVVVALSASALVPMIRAQQYEIPNAVSAEETPVLMRAKLGSSQKVVEGLMAGDFEMIRKGAQDLQQVCDSATWRRHEDQVVTHYRSELRRGAIKLVQQSDKNNLDGAAYTYMHTLTTCINCHEYSRNVLRVASGTTADRVVPIPVSEQEADSYRQPPYLR